MDDRWAEEKAREWCNKMRLSKQLNAPSLAALLREVSDARDRDWQHKMDTEGRASVAAGMRGLLAEVRRVVEEVRFRWETHATAPLVADEILSLLDNLTPSKSKDNL